MSHNPPYLFFWWCQTGLLFNSAFVYFSMASKVFISLPSKSLFVPLLQRGIKIFSNPPLRKKGERKTPPSYFMKRNKNKGNSFTQAILRRCG